VLQYIQLITDKTNEARLSSSVFAISDSITGTIIQNTLLFHKFRQELANSEVTKEALNCIASL